MDGNDSNEDADPQETDASRDEEASGVETTTALTDEADDDAEWFVIHTFAGQEKKTRDRILDTAEGEGLSDIVRDVIVPTTTVTEIKQGNKKEVEKQLYPGYIFIRMVMNEENWHRVRNINGVTGFVGTQMDPIPLQQTEMREVLAQLGQDQSQLEVEFSTGDTVRIISGAMEEMTGTVKEVDIEKTKLRVSVDMFGRSTPVELDFDQAEKL